MTNKADIEIELRTFQDKLVRPEQQRVQATDDKKELEKEPKTDKKELEKELKTVKKDIGNNNETSPKPSEDIQNATDKVDILRKVKSKLGRTLIEIISYFGKEKLSRGTILRF